MALISSVKTLVCRAPKWDIGGGSEFRVLRTLQSPSISTGTSMFSNRGNGGFEEDHTPENYKSRMVEFSGDRSRDFMGQAFDAKHDVEVHVRDTQTAASANGNNIDTTTSSSSSSGSLNANLESYDCHGSIHLNAVMQSTVPEPFTADGTHSDGIHSDAPMHYNMPGGHVRQSHKYLSDDRQNAHYQSTKRDFSSVAAFDRSYSKGTYGLNGGRQFQTVFYLTSVSRRNASSVDDGHTKPAMTSREKLKRAVKDYGATVVVFHVGISLVSLGVCYVLVSSGVDVGSLLEKFVDSSSALTAGVGTFALAYAVHKIFAPVRIGITLTAVPFIVRYLRSIGFLKPPKKL